jgi:hypothetical protein
MLRIFSEGGGKGPLGLEVERWEGVVRDVPQDPVTAKPMTEGDKKVGDILYLHPYLHPILYISSPGFVFHAVLVDSKSGDS